MLSIRDNLKREEEESGDGIGFLTSEIKQCEWKNLKSWLDSKEGKFSKKTRKFSEAVRH